MKAQLSLEALIVFAMALAVFSAVSMAALSRQNDVSLMAAAQEDARSCGYLANEVRSVFLLGDGASGTLRMDSAFSVTGSAAYVGGAACQMCCNLTNGASSSFSMQRGVVRVSNSNGAVRADWLGV
ncbi:MAG: hypothetical protein FJY76_01000 [Candidatus Aenigmarchaeota archaeon]|nr:hypothetical protein [Candidatus Aenigmarchaeota archaeon]